MKHLTSTITCIIILFSFSFLQAQDKWSVELRSGAAFATEELGDADLDTGFGFEANCSYRFLPHLSTYIGWGWNQFSSEQSVFGSELDFEETGYIFGLQFIHPIFDSKLKYMLGAGGIYNHIETENKEGDIIDDTGHGLGWQVESGLVIPLGSKIHLMPSVRYRSLSREIEVSNTSKEVDLKYLSTSVGISWTF